MQVNDFAAFYQAAHGHTPFPWQIRLLEYVVVHGWPRVLSLPTASGKTSVIDVAVFALALQARLPPGERTMPLRIFFVIDRRIVVDEAATHTERLVKILAEEQNGLVGEVAKQLRLFGGNLPLQRVVLRGGLYRDDAWVEAPQQPTVCLTTVDQVGSRLLFRGYGLSSYQFPVHAGLTGNDALYIVDEAHLSQPFIDTLQAVIHYRRWAKRPVGGPMQVVVMSATPPEEETPFRLTDEDWADPVLGQRLRATKSAVLDAPAYDHIEEAMAHHASGFAAKEGVNVVGVVVNRVASARAVFTRLRRQGEAILLTGRIRPYDRDQLLEQWLPRIKAGRDRHGDTPVFVVATQAIEVGANVDFDALVTEVAPLDALRQRFGRLDRLGQRGRSEAVIVVRKPPPGSGPDPVYGSTLTEAWKWLKDNAHGRGKRQQIDFGVAALEALLADARTLPVAAPRRAPVMLPTHLDLWVQTSPRPNPDPDVSPFLHGPESAPFDVQLVWRRDLDEEQEQNWADIVALAPPRRRETLSVPIAAVRNWLRREAEYPISDMEGAEASPDGSRVSTEAERRSLSVLRWYGPESNETRIIAPSAIRPGDTLVLPSSYGGADEFGWAPDSTEPVVDLGDHCAAELARTMTGRRPPLRLRLQRQLVKALLPADLPDASTGALWKSFDAILEALAVPEVTETLADAVEVLLQQLIEFLAPQSDFTDIVNGMCERRNIRVIPYPGRRPAGFVLTTTVPTGFTDDDDSSSLTRPISLPAHSAGVATTARRFAEDCGLPPELVTDLEFAGDLHDQGKADPRFQVMLHGGDELAAAATEVPLAKSGMNPNDLTALRRAREYARLPRGFRHELVSVALAVSADGLLERASDPDLVKYLIGTHHGRARPFPPVITDDYPETVIVNYQERTLRASSNHGLERLDSGWVALFWQLVGRYGYWGLAYCEAVLRLADRARSREEVAQ